MSIRIYTLLALSVLQLALTAPRQEQFPVEKKVLRPSLYAGGIISLQGYYQSKRDALTNTIRLLTRTDKDVTHRPYDYQQAIEEFIALGVVGVEHSDLRLVADATHISRDIAFFKYDVYRHDVLIEDASLSFRFKRGKLIQVLNRSFSEATIIDKRTNNSLSNHQLLHLLWENIGENHYLATGSSYRVLASENGYKLLLVRTFSQQLGQRHRVQLSANTGKIYEVAPTNFYELPPEEGAPQEIGYAKTELYPRWYRQKRITAPLAGLHITLEPIKQDEPKESEPPEESEPPAEGENIFPSLSKVLTDLQGMYQFAANNLPKINGLLGEKVKINNITGANIDLTGVKSNDTWEMHIAATSGASVHNDKRLAQSMVYYHTDKIFRLAANYINPDWFKRTLSAYTNLSRACNAHWDGLRKTVNFYSGNSRCANTGLIADVIYHEWGHGLDAETGGIKDGGFSEGFGDIIAMVMTKSNIVGMGFGLDGLFVRNMEEDRVHPQDAKGGVHEIGKIIGSTFWDMFNLFQTEYTEDETLDTLRNYAFKMILTAEKYTDVYDALLLIDDDDEDLTNGTPNFCLINEPFSLHGLATISRPCLLLDLTTINMQETDGNDNKVIEPNEKISLTPHLENLTKEDLVDLRGKAQSDSVWLAWLHDDIVWSKIAAGEVAASDEPISFQVHKDAPCGEEFTISINTQVHARDKQFPQKFMIGRLAGERELHKGTGFPASIPMKGLVMRSVQVVDDHWLGGTSIHSAHLHYTIKHPYRGDLTIYLVAPSGKKILIKNYLGRGNGTIVYDDEVTELLEKEQVYGEWNLLVEDKIVGHSGTLEDFTLTLVPKIFACAT